MATRRGHSRVTRRPTLSQFCKLDHAIVSPEGGGFRGATDAVLDEHGLSRPVAVSVTHVLFLETVVSRTDLAAVMPFRLVRDHPRLQWFELPVPVPGFDLLMAWPERVHGDPARLWLRDTIATSL
ncbi:LysR substrate-binding domain-containing protein [Luteibacter sp. PPL193]|nr:LysR substrate-binding domain-containing protein [Luteibacter sp. PPL193]